MAKRLPASERRDQLVSAAYAVAVADGIAAVTVRRVAEQAGVSLGVVHYVFAHKDELIVALATRIVDEIAAAADPELDDSGGLDSVLPHALDRMWAAIVDTRGAQLLTYEITAYALRTPGLEHVAKRQYEASRAAIASLLDAVAESTRTRWTRPVGELADEVLATMDGVTLRWLVDGDSAAARARLAASAATLRTHARRESRR